MPHRSHSSLPTGHRMSKVMAVARSCGVVRARTRPRDNVTQVPEVLPVFFGISIINLYVPTVSMEF